MVGTEPDCRSYTDFSAGKAHASDFARPAGSQPNDERFGSLSGQAALFRYRFASIALSAIGATTPLEKVLPESGKRGISNGEDQGGKSGRRARRRRDDPDYLAVHQGKADP